MQPAKLSTVPSWSRGRRGRHATGSSHDLCLSASQGGPRRSESLPLSCSLTLALMPTPSFGPPSQNEPRQASMPSMLQPPPASDWFAALRSCLPCTQLTLCVSVFCRRLLEP